MILKMTHIWYVHVHLLTLDAGAHIKTDPTLAQNKSPATSDSSGDRFKSNSHRVTTWPRWKKNQENSDRWMCFLINSVRPEKSRDSVFVFLWWGRPDYQCGNTQKEACFSSLHCHITNLQYWPLAKLLKYKSSFNIPLAFHQSHPPPHSFCVFKERDIRCTFRMLKVAGVMPRLWKMPMTSFPFQTLEALSYPRSHIRSWLSWIQLYQKVKFIRKTVISKDDKQ